MIHKACKLLCFGFLILATGCNTIGKPLKTVDYVDIDRFMGYWYVIASIPTFAERDAYDPIEHYALNDDGTIATTFRFKKGNPHGDVREISATGFVKNRLTNAVWGVQFIWPIKADYRIIRLDPGYELTMVGRTKRDYLGIMSRHQPIPSTQLKDLVNFAKALGYDTTKIQTTSWQTNRLAEPEAASPGKVGL